MSVNADMIVDLQFGSTGKGLIAGFLAEAIEYDTIINANMPNAGHTYINEQGRKWVHKVLPNGIVSPKLKKVMIGPGSVFNVSQLLNEIDGSKDLLKDKEIYIHESASVLTNSHVQQERRKLNSVASTMQGSAEAMIEKINRNMHVDNRVCNAMPWFPSFTIVTQQEWLDLIYESENILIEGAQGYSLGLNSGFWPYCTSRDCTPARFLADCGVPHNVLGRVVGTARMHPIRVGNTKGGFSGPHYADQKEINWSDLGVEPEKTTVTGRVRRVFTFSREQIKEAIMACQPNIVFLNFCNYDEDGSDRIINIIQEELDNHVPGSAVRFLGHGPSANDIEIVYRGRNGQV